VIVLDASATADLLLRIEPRAGEVRRRLSRPNETLHAPHLLDAEVLQALRRHALRGTLSPERADEALDGLADLRVTRS
jgi:predicted nucleic acid-binding protein